MAVKKNGTQLGFIEIYRPANHAELALIKARLDAVGIKYYVNNEFGTLGSFAGVAADQMIVVVEAARAKDARRIVDEVVRS